ncbi:7729_t:CDS:2 [Paraglomus occultum]|uniref:7729_t:CDS:1 n=1 Tax=Paraglomus occultum TaxID=144539 RepID=A0A9N9FU90_9GLOM|nr:7729_t:CDS:2 [Paraglomus occultum]
MNPFLIAEIVDRVLFYLELDEENLYPCLLVSKLWCTVTAPLLWQDALGNLRIKNVVSIYLHCLPRDDVSELRSRKLIDGVTNPTFRYPTFLKRFSYYSVIFQIGTFLQYNQAQVSYLFGKIWKAMAINETRLTELHINDLKADMPDCLSPLLKLPENRAVIITVKRLMYHHAEKYYDLIRVLADTCSNIKRLHLFDHHPIKYKRPLSRPDMEPIASLISKQKGLKVARFNTIHGGMGVLLPSLQSQLHSLKYIYFTRVDFVDAQSWDVLAQASKMEMLSIKNCMNMRDDMVNPLIDAQLPNLKYVDWDSSPHDTLIQFNKWVDELTSYVDGEVLARLRGKRQTKKERKDEKEKEKLWKHTKQ